MLNISFSHVSTRAFLLLEGRAAKVMGFFDNIYRVIFSYHKGLEHVAEQKNIWQGLGIYLAVTLLALFSTITVHLSVGEEILQVPAELSHFLPRHVFDSVLLFLPVAVLLFHLVFGPLYFLLSVAIFHFLANLFGTRGNVYAVGAVVGYAYLPYLLVALGGLLNYFELASVTLYLFVAALFWSTFLKIAGLKQAYVFAWRRAAFVFFMPLIALLSAIFLFSLLSIVFLIPPILQFLENL